MKTVCVIQYAVWLLASCFSTSQSISALCHWTTAAVSLTLGLEHLALCHYPTHPSHVHLFGFREWQGLRVSGCEKTGEGEAGPNRHQYSPGYCADGRRRLFFAYVRHRVPPSQSVSLAHLFKR